jgi:hypothetical protein
VGFGAGLDVMKNRKTLAPFGNRTPIPQLLKTNGKKENMVLKQQKERRPK